MFLFFIKNYERMAFMKNKRRLRREKKEDDLINIFLPFLTYCNPISKSVEEGKKMKKECALDQYLKRTFLFVFFPSLVVSTQLIVTWDAHFLHIFSLLTLLRKTHCRNRKILRINWICKNKLSLIKISLILVVQAAPYIY